MDLLEEVTYKIHNGYFVDLFVRISNSAAIQMYKRVRGPSLQGKVNFMQGLQVKACTKIITWQELRRKLALPNSCKWE